MAIQQSCAADLSLQQLQALISQKETGPGALVSIVADKTATTPQTIFVLDDSIDLTDAITTLVTASNAPANSPILYLRGSAFVSGNETPMYGFVPYDQALLAKLSIATLMSLGWSRLAAIGIAANIQAESRFDPRVKGDTNTASTAVGICQWRLERKTRDFPAQFNCTIDQSTYQEQLKFIDWELRNTFKAVGNDLKAATTTDSAAKLFCEKYEIPASPSVQTALRQKNAAALSVLV